MESAKDCNCTSSQTDPLCNLHNKNLPSRPQYTDPFANMNNIIEMESEVKIRPRIFKKEIITADPDEYKDEDTIPLPLMGIGDRRPEYRNARMVDNTAMMEMNRQSLRKFESLNVNGKSLTEMTIGGYKVDYEATAAKAMEVFPLPQSKLPVIFVDDNLNFYHHFFEGMKYVVGETLLDGIVTRPDYYGELCPVIIPVIEKLMETSYDRSDTELVMFLRKIFSTTFEIIGRFRRNRSEEEVVVTTNIWGFQYIEPGMKCSEADLTMWLSMCYNHYKTIWFNTFKSTGVPRFAKTSRSQSKASSSSSSGTDASQNNQPRYTGQGEGITPVIEEDDDTFSVRTKSSRRKRRTSRNDALAKFMRN